MTVIVGYKSGSTIWIGADSIRTKDDFVFPCSDKKVFQNGNFLIGFTSSYRMGQILMYSEKIKSLQAPTNFSDLVERFMVNEFIPVVRQELSDGGFLCIESGVELGGQFMVGLSGKLFVVDSDFQVGEYNTYMAIGSGAGTSLGAIHAATSMDQENSIKPEDKILIALRAAADFCPNVGGPFLIKSTLGISIAHDH